MKNRIYITDADYEKLRRLVEGRRAAHSMDRENLERLEEELDRAEVVDAADIPHDVVTMNSEVRLLDVDSGETKVYRLVFPAQYRTGNSISVLAPVGMAMLGYRVGDVIEWPVPKGVRRLKIVEVLYQPEASGVSAE